MQLVVTEKNTKAEILDAYKALLGSQNTPTSQPTKTVNPVPSSTPPQQKILKVKEYLINLVEELEKTFIERSVAIETLEQKLKDLQTTLQTGSKIKLTLEELESLRNQIETEKRNWERKKEQAVQTYQADSAWQTEKLEMELKKRRWSVDEELSHQRELLVIKEQELATTLKEFERLKKEAETIPQRIQDSYDNGKQDGQKEVKQEHIAEKKFDDQARQAQENLLNQKIKTLEGALTDAKQEIALLRKQLETASHQLERLAVATIEAKKPNIPSPTS